MIVGRRGYWHFWAILPLLAAGLASSGCFSSDDGLPRQPVAGTVLFNGKLLSYGTIMFYPEERATKDGPSPSGAVIVNGWFSLPRDKGLAPGKYTISISGEKAKRPKPRTDREEVPPPAKAEEPAFEQIPAKFNSNTELEVEIKEGGIKNLRIELEST
jgi:hypothetical protein